MAEQLQLDSIEMLPVPERIEIDTGFGKQGFFFNNALFKLASGRLIGIYMSEGCCHNPHPEAEHEATLVELQPVPDGCLWRTIPNEDDFNRVLAEIYPEG